MTEQKKRTSRRKPLLIQCGNHFINPSDIRKITKVIKGQKELYCIEFISTPNPDFTCWVRGNDINLLLEQFEVIVSDE